MMQHDKLEKIFNVIDTLGLADKLSAQTSNAQSADSLQGFGKFYIVNENGDIEDEIDFQNTIVEQGRYLMLQRLCGVPGEPDMTNYTVKYFAVGDGATISSDSLLPEKASIHDTDLAHKLAPFDPAQAINGIYLPVSSIVYETQYILRYQIVIHHEVLSKNVKINELGLFASDPNNSDFKLFARTTISEVTLVPTRYYIGDWWIVLRRLA